MSMPVVARSVADSLASMLSVDETMGTQVEAIEAPRYEAPRIKEVDIEQVEVVVEENGEEVHRRPGVSFPLFILNEVQN